MMTDKLIEHVQNSLYNARKNVSKISNDWRILDQYSISSKRFKMLLNNICELENTVYLELGCFRGGTLTSALLNNNTLAAYAVDNFCYDPLSNWRNPETKEISNINPEGWDNVRLSLFSNLEKLNLEKAVRLYVGDWNKVPPTFIKHKITVFHLDIPQNTKAILDFYDAKLDNNFTLVVSNFNIAEVRDAVSAYLTEKNYTVNLQELSLSSSASDTEGWWNGLGLFVIQKKKEIVNA